MSAQTYDVPGNVTIFTAESCNNGELQLGQEVASSGAYSTFVSGCITPEVRLRPSAAGYLIVPSTYSPGVLASFTLNVISDHPIAFELLSR